jgi:predicted AAA+ superfamily ATPase
MRIPRPQLLDAVRAALARSAVTVLTGARQCGKTTLARELLSEEPANYFDLEDPLSLVRQLRPWHANLGKLQVRAPKIYLRDSGLLHPAPGIEAVPLAALSQRDTLFPWRGPGG